MRWYVMRNGETQGPVDGVTVVGWIKGGMREASVRDETGGAWMPLAQSPFSQYVAKPKQSVATLIVLLVILGGVLLFGASMVGAYQPKITQECTMNGFGAGDCRFTNTGQRSGSACGNITVDRNVGAASESSAVFCSGDVARNSTTSVAFVVIGVNKMCASTERPWTEVCSFRFIEKKN